MAIKTTSEGGAVGGDGHEVQKQVLGPDDRTAGDLSPEAAGDTEVLSLSVSDIPIVSPAGKKPRESGIESEVGELYIDPEDDPQDLYTAYRLSPHLKPIIGAMLTGAYCTGGVFAPFVDFDRPEGRKKVEEDLIWRARDPNREVTSEEVDREVARLRKLSVTERLFLESWIEEAVPDMSFDQLKELTGLDLEVTGNAYWEVMRSLTGYPARIQWLPATEMRPCHQSKERVTAKKIVRDGHFNWRETAQLRQFRKYVQLSGGQSGVAGSGILAYFKEYGDPRVMSRRTGKYYSTLDELIDAEQEPNGPPPAPATEIIHLKIASGSTAAVGSPRWSGIYPDMLGSRELSEENLRQVSDSAIPNLLLLVSNGVIGKRAAESLRQQIENRKRGRKEILIVQAQAAKTAPAVPTPNPSIDVVRLRAEQNTDALFQKYDERNEAKAQAAFRLPRALVGKDLGQNRATTQAMLRYAERYVFAPARKIIDQAINGLIIPELGIATRVYASRAIDLADPETMSEITERLIKSSVLSPNEGRSVLGPTVYGKDLPEIDQVWAQIPPPILLLFLQTRNQELASALLSNDPDALDQVSSAIRDMLETRGSSGSDGSSVSGSSPGDGAPGDGTSENGTSENGTSENGASE